MGGFVSFAGNVSYKTAETLRDAARVVPLDRLLVETDSPYLSPIPHRGRPNEPRNVADVGAALAAATGRPVAEIAEATTANARRAFRLGA
jgi:TatD DNase family protein